MAQAVNVILQIADTGKQFNINDMGLIDLEFDRMPVTSKDKTRSFLPEIQIQVMDKTGTDLMSILQQNANNLLLKYGFDDDMSEVYRLTAVKIKLVLDNLGSMITIQAVGSQVVRTTDGEIYLEGTKVLDILKTMARRNGWYTGENDSYIEVGNIVLNRNLVKRPGVYDYDFIESDILPLLKSTVVSAEFIESSMLNYWEMSLVPTGSRTEFYCRPYSSKNSTRRVWVYEHGSINPQSEVISFTNDIDMTFLINGINLQIPMTAVDSSIVADEDAFKERLESMALDRLSEITAIIKEYNLPIPDPDNFRFNIEVVEAENVGNKSFSDLLLEKLEDTIKVLSTGSMTVVGNPKIMPTDLIEFRAKNRDGSNSIISSSGLSYWRVIGIREKISMAGYQTTLSLVRENVSNIIKEKTVQPSKDMSAKDRSAKDGLISKYVFDNPVKYFSEE